jgi:hypothetical protein
MKRIVTLLLTLLSLASRGQIIQYLGGPTTQIYVRGQLRVDTVIYLPLRDTTFTPTQVGAVVVKSSNNGLYLWNGTRWLSIPLGTTAWGQISGSISAQSDLIALLGGYQPLLTAGYGIKLTGATLAFDSARVRKVDTMLRLNDSTISYTINGISHSVLLRGTAAGGISSLALNAPSGVFGTPVNFTNTGGAWAGSLSLNNQSNSQIFAGPITGTGPPTFRAMVVGDLPTSIPNAYLQNSNITLTLGSAGLSPAFASSTVALGGTILLNVPTASSTTTGFLSSTDWVTFHSSAVPPVTSVNGQLGAVVTKSADSIKGLPVDTSIDRNLYAFLFDSVNHKIILGPAGSGGGGSGTVTSVGLALPSIFNVTVTPVTTSGTLTAIFNAVTQNMVFAAPPTSTGLPSFRGLQIVDLPSTGVTAGTYNNVQVDVQGLVVAGTSQAYITLSSLSALAPATYNNATGVIGVDTTVGSQHLATQGFVSRQITFISAVQGLHASVTGDSVLKGGFYYQNDTTNYGGFSEYWQNMQGKATIAGTDSVIIKTAAGLVEAVPNTVFSGGGGGSETLQQVFNQQNPAILTISDTINTITNAVPLTFLGNIRFASPNATYSFGDLTHVASQFYTRNISSDGSLALSYATTGALTFAQNGVAEGGLLTTNQFYLNSYIGSVFAGTVTGGTPDSVLTINNGLVKKVPASALGGGSTITLTGTSGGGLVSSAFTFATATSTSNTALTIPGSGTTFTFTYNPAWDFIDKSLASVTSVFLGTTMGNATLTGTGDIGIGAAGSQNITSGTNNIGIGPNTLFALTTATGDIAIGDLALAADISGGQNTAMGVQSLRNNTATENTAYGWGSGASNSSGTANTFLGFQAGFANNTGLGNTFAGNQAGKNNTTGPQNSFDGYLAGTTQTTGSNNTGHGFGNMSGLIDGSFNSGFGSLFMDFGIHNFYFTGGGYKAAALDTGSIGSTILGSYAASATLGLNYDVIIGDSAIGSSFPVGLGSATRSSTKAVLIGAYVGVVNTPANMAHYDSSVIIGYGNKMAESSTDTLGYNLVMIGFGDTTSRHDVIILGNKNNQVINTSYGGGMNTAAMNLVNARVGDQLYNTDSVGPVFYNGTGWVKMFGGSGGGGGVTTVGTFSGSSIANGASISTSTITFGPADATNPGMVTTGTQTFAGAKTFNAEMVIDGVAAGKGLLAVSTNTAFGVLALRLATGGTNTGIGNDALANTVGGTANTAVGSTAMLTNSTGSNNTAIGAGSLNTNTTASNNVSIGSQALHTEQVQGNQVAIGFEALNAELTGANNLAIGYTAMLADTSGPNNIVIGNGSLTALLSGAANFVIGNQSGNTLTTGGGNVLMGYKIDVASASTSNTLNIAGLIFGQGLSTAGGSGFLGGTVGIGVVASSTNMLALVQGSATNALSTSGNLLLTVLPDKTTPASTDSVPYVDNTGKVWKVPEGSGTYTVTITPVSNCTTTGTTTGHWIRIGNQVTVNIATNLNLTTGATLVEYTMSLPIASTISIPGDVSGLGETITATTGGMGITGNTSTHTADAQFTPVSSGATNIYIQFTYTID